MTACFERIALAMKTVNCPKALTALAANVQCNLPPLGARSYYRNLCYVYCLITRSINLNFRAICLQFSDVRHKYYRRREGNVGMALKIIRFRLMSSFKTLRWVL